jgi:hypothetical protein
VEITKEELCDVLDILKELTFHYYEDFETGDWGNECPYCQGRSERIDQDIAHKANCRLENIINKLNLKLTKAVH